MLGKQIYDGLDHVSGDPHMTKDQVQDIQLFDLKRGGCEAIVHFFHIEDAESFVDKNAPTLALPLLYTRGKDSRPVMVGVDFDLPRDDDSSGPYSDSGAAGGGPGA